MNLRVVAAAAEEEDDALPTTSYRVYVANETDTIATYDRAFLEDTHSLIRYDNYSYGGSIWNTDIYTDGDGEGKYWELGMALRSGGGQQAGVFNYWIYTATANSLQPTASTSYVDQGPTGYNHGHNYGLFLHFKLHSVPSDIATDTNHIMHQWFGGSFAYQLDWVSGTQIVVKGKTSGSSFTNYSNNITISPAVYNKMCMVVNKFSGEERIAFFLNGVKQFDSSDSSAGVGHATTLGTSVTDLLTGYRTGSTSDQYLFVLRDISGTAFNTPAKMKDLRFFNQVLTDAQAISLTLTPAVAVMDVVFDPAPTGGYIPTNGSGSTAEGTLLAPTSSFTTVSGVTLIDGTTSGRVGNTGGTYYFVAPNGAHKGVSTIECIIQITNGTGNLSDLSDHTQFTDSLFMLGNYSDKTYIRIKSSDGTLQTLIADSTASSTYTDGNGIKYRELASTVGGAIKPNTWHVVTITFESPGGSHGNNTMDTVKTYVDGFLEMTTDISSYSSSTWYTIVGREIATPRATHMYYQQIRSYDLPQTASEVLARYQDITGDTTNVIVTSPYSTDAQKKAACTFDVANLDTRLHSDFTFQFSVRNFEGSTLRFGFGMSPISPRNSTNTEAYFYIAGWGTSTASCIGDFNVTTITIASFDMTSYDTTEWLTIKIEYEESNSGHFQLYLNGTAIGSGISSTWSAHSGLENFAVGYPPP